MNKPFLLIVNDQYYPSSGTGDWVCCYECASDAIEAGKALCGDDEDKSYTVVNLAIWINSFDCY